MIHITKSTVLSEQFSGIPTLTVLYRQQHYVGPECFRHLRRKPHTHESVGFHSPLPSAPGDDPPASVSVELPLLDLSFKENYIMCGLGCLASFTQHIAFEAHPCCSTSALYFFLRPNYTYILHFVYPFIPWWTSRPFPRFGCCE